MASYASSQSSHLSVIIMFKRVSKSPSGLSKLQFSGHRAAVEILCHKYFSDNILSSEVSTATRKSSQLLSHGKSKSRFGSDRPVLSLFLEAELVFGNV